MSGRGVVAGVAARRSVGWLAGRSRAPRILWVAASGGAGGRRVSVRTGGRPRIGAASCCRTCRPRPLRIGVGVGALAGGVLRSSSPRSSSPSSSPRSSSLRVLVAAVVVAAVVGAAVVVVAVVVGALVVGGCRGVGGPGGAVTGGGSDRAGVEVGARSEVVRGCSGVGVGRSELGGRVDPVRLGCGLFRRGATTSCMRGRLRPARKSREPGTKGLPMRRWSRVAISRAVLVMILQAAGARGTCEQHAEGVLRSGEATAGRW